MIVENFADKDVEAASKIAHLVWGDLYIHESKKLQKLIYDFMVKYYDLNRKYSFALHNNDFKGFILTNTKFDKNDSVNLFKEEAKLLDAKEQKTAVELADYLEACGKEVKAVMQENDIMIGLFISCQKGGGKMLLSKLIETCRSSNIKNIYLWTDTTCDYDYYQKNKFTLVKEIKSNINSKNIDTLIFKKEV